jgi:hypothetical protein
VADSHHGLFAPHAGVVDADQVNRRFVRSPISPTSTLPRK